MTKDEAIRECDVLYQKASDIAKEMPLETWHDYQEDVKRRPLLYAKMLLAHAMCQYAPIIKNEINSDILVGDSIDSEHFTLFENLDIFEGEYMGLFLSFMINHLWNDPNFYYRNLYPNPVNCWSIRDILGTAKNLIEEFYCEKYNRNDVFQLITKRKRIIDNYQYCFGDFDRASDRFRYYDETKREVAENLVPFRKPLWILCDDPESFISEFTENFDNIKVKSYTGENLCTNGVDSDITINKYTKLEHDKLAEKLGEEGAQRRIHPELSEYRAHGQAGAGVIFIYSLPDNTHYREDMISCVINLIGSGKVGEDVIGGKWQIVILTKNNNFNYHWLMSPIYEDVNCALFLSSVPTYKWYTSNPNIKIDTTHYVDKVMCK